MCIRDSTVAVPAPLSVTFWFAPPLILYVTVAWAIPVIVNCALAPEQIGVVTGATVAVGSGFTTTVAVPVSVWLHVPLVTDTSVSVWFVVAAGTVTVAVPPAPIVIVRLPAPRLYVTTSPAVPVIVNCASAPGQIGVVTGATVAVGSGFTTTVAVPVSVWLHVPLVTDTRVSVWFVVAAGTVTVAVPPAPIVIVRLPAPRLYVTTSPAVPVIVNCASAPEQIGVVTGATVAVGSGFTTTVAVPVSVWLHVPLVTETSVSVWFVVAAGTVTVAVPPAPIVIVRLPAPRLYVTTSPAVPVIVNCALAPEQIGVVTGATVAVGSGFTTTVAVPVSVWLHVPLVTETSVSV